MVKNFIIGDLMIDSADAGMSRDFYSSLMGYEKIVALLHYYNGVLTLAYLPY